MADSSPVDGSPRGGRTGSISELRSRSSSPAPRESGSLSPAHSLSPSTARRRLRRHDSEREMEDELRAISYARGEGKNFEKRKRKEQLEERMQRLLRETSQVRNAESAMEMRGVVVTLSGLYRRQKLTERGRSVLNEMAMIISRYSDLRIMVIGHTTSRGKRQAKLNRSEKLANQARDVIMSKVTSSVQLSVVGRGDYVPYASNPRSPKNERIEVVFFKPRIQ